MGVAAAASAGLLLVGGLAFKGRQLIQASRVPPLPDLASQPEAVRRHLADARAGAFGRPLDASAVGAYCFALHADMFLDAAARCYALAERLDPSNWRWTYYRALVLNERGGGDAFARAMQSVLERAPDYGPAWWRLGEAEFKQGRYDRAADAWRRAAAAGEPPRGSEWPPHVADVPLAAYASFGLARVALAGGDAQTARRLLETAISQAPRFGPAYRLLGEAEAALGDAAAAERAIARASRLPPYAPYADPMVDVLARTSENATFLLRQASDADLDANAAWSEFLVRRALAADPNDPDVLAKLGRILRYLGRNEEALAVFQEYAQKVPGDFQGLAQIGSCLSDLQRFDEAERYLRRALEGNDDALTHYNLGVVLAATGRVEEAIAEYRRALARDPALDTARNNLAAALARTGRLAEAERELTRILDLDPDNALARANLQRLKGR